MPFNFFNFNFGIGCASFGCFMLARFNAGRLRASLTGMDYCIFDTKAHDRFRVNVTEYRSGPFESYHKDDKVTFYVFDATVFNNVEWAEIVNRGKCLAKYQYSAREVVERDKSIVYIGE